MTTCESHERQSSTLVCICAKAHSAILLAFSVTVLLKYTQSKFFSVDRIQKWECNLHFCMTPLRKTILNILTITLIQKLSLAHLYNRDIPDRSRRDHWFHSIIILSDYAYLSNSNEILLTAGTKFLSHSPLWENSRNSNESIRQDMGEMDENCAIGIEMFRDSRRNRDVSNDDIDQRQ